MIQLSDAQVLVNNEVVGIHPNSLKFTEGLGEQKVRAVSVGEGKTEQVYARDLESNFARVIFELPTTPEYVKLARQWKTNGNQNVVSIAGSTAEGTVTRSFTKAALVGDYEVNVGSDGTIEIEFHANQAI